VALVHVSIYYLCLECQILSRLERSVNHFSSFNRVQREAWQSVMSIIGSKAEVSSFCLELAKKLDMRYKSPPLPVDLAFIQRNNIPTTASIIPENNNPAGVVTADTNSELGARIAAAMASSNISGDEVSTGRYKEVAAMFDRN
jgi:hypothetical protein